MNKKDALKGVLAKARALSEIPERSDEQNAELEGHMAEAKGLRNDIVRDTALDEFTTHISDEVGPDKPAADAKSEVALGYDGGMRGRPRSEEHTSELQSLRHLVCRLLLEKKNEQLRRGDARVGR